jgi:transposase-like protein
MKNILDFETLSDFMEHFHDEDTCRAYFAGIRFRNGEYCPHCGHKEIWTYSGGKKYRCAACKENFTIVTKSVFGATKVPLRKWFIAIYLLSTTSKGISSIQLAKHVGVTQKTAWFMDHRLRSAMKQNDGQLFGTVEVDETYIGGLAKNMHAKAKAKSGVGTGGKGKAIVMGMRQRGGEVRASVITGTDAEQLHQQIQKTVMPGSTVYTDEHRGYNGLKDYVRYNVNHGKRQFVLGKVHTNGMESFWALFKRGYHGVYHQMSRKHLPRYVDEFAFRLNRKDQVLHERFADVVLGTTDNPQLPYKELIA